MDAEKFARVLALAESDHPGEAQSALRAARLMLARAGLSFRDLTPRALTVPTAANSSYDASALLRIAQLEQRVEDLQHKLERQRAVLQRQSSDIERWRKIARETAEQLWISGQRAARHHDRPNASARRRAVVDTLNDPAGNRLGDREIARRIGVPVSTVAYWRWRLAVELRRRLKEGVRGRSGLRRQQRPAGLRPPAETRPPQLARAQLTEMTRRGA